MEQPRDYVVQSFEEKLAEEYNNLSVFQKIIYRMQDYVLTITFSSLVLGYLAGLYFGKFW